MSLNRNMRNIHKVDDLLRRPELASCLAGHAMKTAVIREVLEEIRIDLLSVNGVLPPEAEICTRILTRLNQMRRIW